MSWKAPVIARSIATADDLTPAPIDPSWIIEGAPQARSRPLSLATDGTIGASLWDCTAGRFEWRYGGDELIHILEGEAELTSPSGAVTIVRRGDIVHFPSGQRVRWHIPAYVKKVAIQSDRVSLPRRLAQRVPLARRVVHMIRAARARSWALVAGGFEVASELALLAL